MVLRSLLISAEDHKTLLELVRCWPPGLFSMPTLVDAVEARMKKPDGDGPDLWALLALLYQRQVIRRQRAFCLVGYLNPSDLLLTLWHSSCHSPSLPALAPPHPGPPRPVSLHLAPATLARCLCLHRPTCAGGSSLSSSSSIHPCSVVPLRTAYIDSSPSWLRWASWWAAAPPRCWRSTRRRA